MSEEPVSGCSWQNVEFLFFRGDPGSPTVRPLDPALTSAATALRLLVQSCPDADRVGIVSLEVADSPLGGAWSAVVPNVFLGCFAVSRRLFHLGLISRGSFNDINGVRAALQVCLQRGLRVLCGFAPLSLVQSAQASGLSFVGMGAISTDELSRAVASSISRRVLVDCDFLKPFHNGTHEAVRNMLPGIVSGAQAAGFEVTVVAPSAAAAFHGLGGLRCALMDRVPDDQHHFHAVIRLAQPWNFKVLRRLRSRAAYVYCYFYDAIAHEIGFVPPRLWHRCLPLMDRLFTCSEYSTRQVQALFPRARTPAAAGYLRVDLPGPGVLPDVLAGRRFHFVPGNFVPIKMLDVVLDRLCTAFPGELFVSQGKQQARHPNLLMAAEGVTADETIDALYRYCASLVMPSVYEGLGLPWVKAAALGRPTHVLRSTLVDEMMEIYGLSTDVVHPFSSLDELIENMGTLSQVGTPREEASLAPARSEAVSEIVAALTRPTALPRFPW